MLDNNDDRRIASGSVIGRIVKVMIVHLVQSMRGIEFISYRNSVLHLFLGTLAEKKAKCGNLSTLPVWECHVCDKKNYGLFCILGP